MTPDAAGSRKILERPTAIVSLIAGILGILTGIATLLGAFSGGDEDEPAAAGQIAECVSAHGLASATTEEEIAPGRVVFRACAWPAPPGAESDGFTEITVASGQGPGGSEAEGLTVADVFTTTCRDLEVRYLFDNMGTFVPEQPVRLSKGEIRRVEGGSVWTPRNNREASLYTPRRDQAVIMSAARYRLDTARCVS